MPARTTQQVRVGSRSLELSNLEKVFYPATGFTKGQVIDYYSRIAPAMVPHLKGRPLNLKRYPNGVEAPFFFQKEAPSNTPAWLRVFEVWSDTRGGPIRFCTANDTASLVWLANTGNLEFHSLLSRAPDAETPTMMVFDLDPGPGAGLLGAAAVALLVHDALQSAGLEAFPKVSGGKGVQVYVPLNTPVTFEATRNYSLAVAQSLERRHPTAIVSNMRKDLRQGKVLIDYSQNSRHKSTVSPYSLRARTEPSVSAPVTWKEIDDAVTRRDEDRLRFTPEQVLLRVAKQGDLFAPILSLRQRLESRRPRGPPARASGEPPSRRPTAKARPKTPTRASPKPSPKSSPKPSPKSSPRVSPKRPPRGKHRKATKLPPGRGRPKRRAGNSKNAGPVRRPWAQKPKAPSPSGARKSRSAATSQATT